jgi:hypothetical protein
MIRKAFTIAALVLAAGVAWAQQPPPLGELARKEAERRKAAKAPTKVYTNADVKSRPVTTATSRAEEPKKEGAAAESATQPPGEKPAEQGTVASAEARDEAWWRKRMSEITQSLNRNRVLADALQSRINALWADFTSRDDPAQRGVIEANRREALAELDRVKVEIVRLQQALADLEEEARRAGVPPGWLR